MRTLFQRALHGMGDRATMAELVEWACDWLGEHAQRNGQTLPTEHPQFRAVVQRQLAEEIAAAPHPPREELEALWATVRPIIIPLSLCLAEGHPGGLIAWKK